MDYHETHRRCQKNYAKVFLSNWEEVNLKDFIKDSSLMPKPELAKRYGLSHDTINDYFRKYNLTGKKIFGKGKEDKEHKKDHPVNTVKPSPIDMVFACANIMPKIQI